MSEKKIAHQEQGQLGNALGSIRTIRKHIRNLHSCGATIWIPTEAQTIEDLDDMLAKYEKKWGERVTELTNRYWKHCEFLALC
jgi:hypothetical protein